MNAPLPRKFGEIGASGAHISPNVPVVPPGATIGVVGAGQLGRMLALAARPMGYRVHVLTGDPDAGADTPAGQVADAVTAAAFDDLAAVRAFVDAVHVVTFEFENVDTGIAAVAAERGVPVRPSGALVHVAQHRGREKAALVAAGIRVARHAHAATAVELAAAVGSLGAPVIAKTAAFGYDGKGQVRITDRAQVADAWHALGGEPLVVEAVVPFDMEVSVVVARAVDGSIADYGVIENVHVDGILDTSVWPARISRRVAGRARATAHRVAEVLDLVGVMCVEMFVVDGVEGGDVVVNEIAPRPHNSGHLTIEAAVTSQFAQQVRAVCALPLGSTEMRPAAMVNLLGDVWSTGEPAWAAALADPGLHLHLYGKATARSGRKMGHLTVVAASGDTALARVHAARAALTPGYLATSGRVVPTSRQISPEKDLRDVRP